MKFDTKIAIVLRKNLAPWQKLNVTAFLVSGVVGATPDILGEPYEDASGNIYNGLVVQPMIVLSADGPLIETIYRRALTEGVRMSLYIEDMFSTSHDAANRESVKCHASDDMPVVGLAFREMRKVVDKLTKGARMHP